MHYGLRALGLALVFLFAGERAAAQQEQQTKDRPDAPVAQQAQPPQKHDNRFQTTIGILGRRSIFFPDLAVSPGPLRSKQKLELFADKSIAPSRFLSSGLGAAISQAQNSLPAYGQGFAGYGKRLGTSMASGASSEFFGTFLLASALHRDPRYFVSLEGGVWKRIGYGASRLLVSRSDRGTTAANWPGLFGPLLAEGLANSYLPVKEQTAARTFRRYGVRLGFTAATNILKEYWPTIFRSLRITKLAPSLNPTPPSTPPSPLR